MAAFLHSRRNQTLTLGISPSKFPAWTRGKTITVTAHHVLAVAWPPGNFVLVPQAPLPTTPINHDARRRRDRAKRLLGHDRPRAGTLLGTWSFELQQQGAPDFQSLTANVIGDVLLLMSYDGELTWHRLPPLVAAHPPAPGPRASRPSG